MLWEFFPPAAPLHSQASPAESHQGSWAGSLLTSDTHRDISPLPRGFCGLKMCWRRLREFLELWACQILTFPSQVWELSWFPGTIPSVPSLKVPPCNGIQASGFDALFPSGTNCQIQVLGDILVTLRGCTRSPGDLLLSGKSQSISAPPRVHLPATEQSLGVEFTSPITSLRFWWLHPSQGLLALFLEESWALSSVAIHVSGVSDW